MTHRMAVILIGQTATMLIPSVSTATARREKQVVSMTHRMAVILIGQIATMFIPPVGTTTASNIAIIAKSDLRSKGNRILKVLAHVHCFEIVY